MSLGWGQQNGSITLKRDQQIGIECLTLALARKPEYDGKATTSSALGSLKKAKLKVSSNVATILANTWLGLSIDNIRPSHIVNSFTGSFGVFHTN